MAVALNYRSEGTAGPFVVILHGLLGSSGNWRSIARSLGETHRVYSLDLRNHGASPHVDTMTYQDMADDVRGFLDERGIDAATVIGHSMGGKTAMVLALDAPERVQRLVVVDIAPTVSHQDHGPTLTAMTALDLRRIGRRADAEAMLEASIPDAAMRMFVLQNLASSPEGFAWRINLAGIAASMPALLDFPVDPATQPYTGPTRFLRGANSDYVRPADEATIRALFPHAEIVTIEGAGHWVHAEQPARFLEALGE
jgi:pimeloyl-ACP methyl ester carboxylesterase